MPKHNILYIHSHDTGRYIQPYGHAIATPSLQRLAEQGVLFRRNFCANPTCSASRATLLTGRYPHANGMTGLAHRGFRLNDYGRHLIHTLRREGYYSVLAGVQHVARDTEGKQAWEIIGYDRYYPHIRTFPGSAQGAREFLENAPPQPFFLSVGFGHTHRRYPEHLPEDDPRYTLPPAPLPDTPETREDMANFKTAARHFDARVGYVLDALERSGLAENTVVICTTDHGIAFPRMKCNLTDGGIGVMLIVRGPGGFRGGRVIDSLVSHIDIFPTLCDLLEIEPPDWLQGVSLMPIIRREAEDVRDEIHAEVNYHAAWEPMRCVRTNRWKYIKRLDDRDAPVLPNCDAGPSKTLWMDHDWVHAPDAREQEMLYDLVFDPNESHNLANHPQCAAILEDMRARMRRWMEETDDPLLDSGLISAPEGAVISDPDAVRPEDLLPPEEIEARYRQRPG